MSKEDYYAELMRICEEDCRIGHRAEDLFQVLRDLFSDIKAASEGHHEFSAEGWDCLLNSCMTDELMELIDDCD